MPRHHPVWNVPNALSVARVPLAIAFCGAVTFLAWGAAIVVFLLALVSDWADGFWARRYGPMTKLGRTLDPLTDKVFLGAALIYLQNIPTTGVAPWMTTLVVVRELLVTGVRGVVEAEGFSFGADRYGKLKTALQFLAVLAILVREWLCSISVSIPYELTVICRALLGAMLLATLGSGLQYLWRAVQLLSGRSA